MQRVLLSIYHDVDIIVRNCSQSYVHPVQRCLIKLYTTVTLVSDVTDSSVRLTTDISIQRRTYSVPISLRIHDRESIYQVTTTTLLTSREDIFLFPRREKRNEQSKGKKISGMSLLKLYGPF